MRYLLAPDSFKESLSASEVAEAMERGIQRADPKAQCRLLPLSDGGEGLTDALVNATGGEFRFANAHDALGRPIQAKFGFLGEDYTDDNTFADNNLFAADDDPTARAIDNLHVFTSPRTRTAVVELAAASGLERIADGERDALAASTFGTGELIRAAIDAGAWHIVLGLGGSATTDGGSGLARALGFRLVNEYGEDLPLGGGSLIHLARIDGGFVPERVRSTRFTLACDVTNPLTGPMGASYVFGPQKGANARQMAVLDKGLQNFADVVMRYNGSDIRDIPGSGAAGGTAAGMLGLFDAEIMSGIELVLELSHAHEACDWADLVITGEGSIDVQTLRGKAPAGIARLAQSCGVPVVAIGGKVTRDIDVIDELCDSGIQAVFGIAPGAADLPTLLADASSNIEAVCSSIAGLAASLRSHHDRDDAAPR